MLQAPKGVDNGQSGEAAKPQPPALWYGGGGGGGRTTFGPAGDEALGFVGLVKL